MRIGKFYITQDFVEDGSEWVAKMLSRMQFVPLRVEALSYRGVYEYIGISKLFEDILCGAITPEYNIQISHDIDTDEISVVAIKIVPA